MGRLSFEDFGVGMTCVHMSVQKGSPSAGALMRNRSRNPPFGSISCLNTRLLYEGIMKHHEAMGADMAIHVLIMIMFIPTSRGPATGPSIPLAEFSHRPDRLPTEPWRCNRWGRNRPASQRVDATVCAALTLTHSLSLSVLSLSLSLSLSLCSLCKDVHRPVHLCMYACK